VAYGKYFHFTGNHISTLNAGQQQNSAFLSSPLPLVNRKAIWLVKSGSTNAQGSILGNLAQMEISPENKCD